MKSAMQELIEIINDNLINEYTSQEFARLTIFKASAERLLEKEKEQLEEARLKGYGEGYNEGIYDAENK
jgi:flagellar biosynthesis/type III secretory pathway protein FliH